MTQYFKMPYKTQCQTYSLLGGENLSEQAWRFFTPVLSNKGNESLPYPFICGNYFPSDWTASNDAAGNLSRANFATSDPLAPPSRKLPTIPRSRISSTKSGSASSLGYVASSTSQTVAPGFRMEAYSPPSNSRNPPRPNPFPVSRPRVASLK